MRLVENLTGNMVMIGTVLAPRPIYHRNALMNFADFKTHSYEFYRAIRTGRTSGSWTTRAEPRYR